MKVNRPLLLAQVDSLSIKFGTYFKTVRVTSAKLYQPASSCGFYLAEPSELPDGAYLNFVPTQCNWQSETEFVLEVQGERIEGLAVLGYKGLSETQNNPNIYAVGTDGAMLAAAGSFQPKLVRLDGYWPRVRLLAYMWKWTDHWFAFSSIILLAFGLISLCFAFLLSIAIQQFEVNRWKLILVASALIAGLQLSYAFLSPPFQAPDEPDHFLTFSQIGGLKRAGIEGISLANHSHFDRLMCHVNEKFTKADIARPMEQTRWNEFHVGYVDVAPRSAYAFFLWPYIARSVFNEGSSPEVVHIGLRLFNGLYFFVIFLLSLVIYRNLSSFDLTDYLLCLVIVPTLFHFSNHNSNHVFIISHYLPLVLSFRAVLTGADLTRPAMLWIGLNLGLCFLSGRLGLIFMLVAYICFFTRFTWIGSQFEFGRKAFRKQISDFICLTLPCVLLVFFFRDSAYLASQLNAVDVLTGIVGTGFVVISGAAIVLPLAGITAGRMLNFLLRHKVASSYFKIALWCASASVLALLFFPLIKDLPGLENIEYLEPRISGWHYTLKVLKHFALSWGWGGQDFYLIESFWGGFGCPEPVVGNAVVQIIKGSLATMIAVGFVQTVRKEQCQLSFVLIACFILLAIYLGLLAYGSAAQPSNLHGRYMIGFYLIMIQTAVLCIKGDRYPKCQLSMPIWGVLSMLLVQVASIWYVSGRYF